MKHLKKSISENRSRAKERKFTKKDEQEMKRLRDELINGCLDSNNPPELRSAFERMLQQSYDEEYTRERINTVFTLVRLEEIVNKTPFDMERFKRLLNELPYISPDEGVSNFDLEAYLPKGTTD
jgi:hypothetical protein